MSAKNKAPERAKKSTRAAPAAGGAVVAAPRLDGWVNLLTGLGAALHDKRLAASANWDPITEEEADELYAGDDLAEMIVDALPDDAIRQWLALEIEDKTAAAATEKAMDVLKVADRLRDAWQTARRTGGSGVLMMVDDSAFLAEPLIPARVRAIKSLVVLSKRELIPSRIDTNLDSQNYGMPETYFLQPMEVGASAGGGQAFNVEVHHSRILRFDGAKLPKLLMVANNYWGDSVLTRARNAIRNYSTSHDAAAVILQHFSQGVFKMKDMAEMILQGPDGEQQVARRLAILEMARSICRAVVVDSEDEFSTVGAAVTGIPDMLRAVAGRLVVSSKMPHTKILGESPSGLGASGRSEERTWYDFVSAQQESILRPHLEWFLRILFSAKQGPTRGVEPKAWSFEFKPLWQESDGDQAKTRKTQAEVDDVYLRHAVLDPAEVAESRFGSGKYSTATALDVRTRRALAGQRTAGGSDA